MVPLICLQRGRCLQPHRERAAHALRQAKNALVSSLPSIASIKSSKQTPAYCAARNERKKSRTGFGSRPSLRLAQRCARPRQHRARRQAALPHTRHRQRRLFARRKLFDNVPARRFRIFRVAVRADHRLIHSRLAFVPHRGSKLHQRTPAPLALSFPRKRESSSPMPLNVRTSLSTSSCYWMPAFAGMTVDMLLRCRDAFEASGVCCSFLPTNSPKPRRGGAPKNAILWHPHPLPDAAGAFRRASKRSSSAKRDSANKRLCATQRADALASFAMTCGPPGRAFAVSAPPTILAPFPTPLHSCARRAPREK